MSLKRIVSVVGARPQFVKAAVVSHAIERGARWEETLVHTGQHHDAQMSEIFFSQLGLRPAKHHLGIAGGPHGEMTGRMLQALEPVLQRESPHAVMVYGDTNSTLAGALAAAKLDMPVVHVEAGLRSHARSMPEEINRKLVDHLSSLLLCPTEQSVAQLAAEGIRSGVHLVGDVMLDAALHYGPVARQHSRIIPSLGLREKGYVLASCHRAGNVDDREHLGQIMQALAHIAQQEPVVLPLHPRTRARLEMFGLMALLDKLRVTPPLGYLDMLQLEQQARLVMTDSGGVQKEAYFFGVPCITLRGETEWPETTAAGWNTLAGHTLDVIVAAYHDARTPSSHSLALFGDGAAAQRIERLLETL